MGSSQPQGLSIRTPEEADWPAMSRVAAACFGGNRRPQEATDTWRTMMPENGPIVACDGTDVVGVAAFLDLKLTVPGGAVLPMAGVTWVAVSPTHRRRGVLSAMFTELHSRMDEYPIAGLQASEAGIYGRFGYGPATVEHRLTVDRRDARFFPDVPDPRGVRVVELADHHEQIAEIYERVRLQTPGGIYCPPQLWADYLSDRESDRDGGSEFFCLLHADGYALYRTRESEGPSQSSEEKKKVDISELAAVTPEAHIALWRVLLGMDLIETVTAWTTPDDVLPYLLTDPRLVRTLVVEDALWLRMRDIPAVLEARSYASDVSAVLDISDDVLGGGGRYALEVHDGKARCVLTEAPADVHTDLSVLGSLYMGGHRASSFATANRLRCRDFRLVAELDAAFATDVPAHLGYGF